MAKAAVQRKYRYDVVTVPLSKGHPFRNMGEWEWYYVYDKELEQRGLGAYATRAEAQRICDKKNGI
jgi:hypothetical protein